MTEEEEEEETRAEETRESPFMRGPAGSARQKFFQLRKTVPSLIPRASIFIAKRVT